MTASIFGQIIGGDDLEQAVNDTLTLWLPTYLREIERQKSLDVDVLKTITRRVTLTSFGQPQDLPLPFVAIVCPGIASTPERGGDRDYRYWYTVGVFVLVEARDDEAARELAQMYVKAMRALFVQHPALGGVASTLTIEDEGHENAPPDYERAGCAIASVSLAVLLERVVTALAGPAVPDDDPAPWPTVETVHIDAERRTS